MSKEQFDLKKASEKYGRIYNFKKPNPKCKTCNGKGLHKKTLCLGMEQSETTTYCDCVIKGMNFYGGKK